MGTIGEALQAGEGELAATSASARLDAELLLSYVLRFSRTQLLVRLREELSPASLEGFQQLVARRKNGEPVAYILGEREFFGRNFSVSPSVLIPRPESELIIEEALRAVAGKTAVSFVDLGTGSGCLAVTLALELAARGVVVRGLGVDISKEALAVAAKNAEALRASQYLTFVESSWLSRREAFHPPYDIIVANPPYVDPAEPAPRELAFEPQGALYSSDSGLQDAREILRSAPEFLVSGGTLLLEVGAGKRGRLSHCPEVVALRDRVTLLGDSSPLDRFTVVKVRA